MSSIWRKIVGDLRQERSRAILVVLAIALGVAGFTAVLASFAILQRELNTGYLATNPASATLYTDAVDDDLLRGLLAEGKVSHAEARRRLGGRIRSGPGRWRNLQLFVVPDFARIEVSRLESEAGAWPPATGEILIERDAFQVLKGQIGDLVKVRTNAGNEWELRVAGRVKDVGQAQARMENLVYGYISLDTLKLLGEPPRLDQVLILAAENRFDENHVREVAEHSRRFLEKKGHPVRKVEVPKPGAHPHADLMGTLLLAKAGFGLFVLILSSVLVVQLLTALLAAQVRQIAILKTLGARRGQIAGIYFGEVFVLGLAALAVGVPLGLWGSRLLCRYQSKFLNFDVDSFAVPPWVFALVALVGLALPLLAAAWPIWRGCRGNVLAALADHGVEAGFGKSRFDRWLALFGGAARPALLAIRNTFRRRTRLMLTVLTLSLAGLFFIAALNVRASLIHTLDVLFGSRRYDLTVSLAGMSSRQQVETLIRQMPEVQAAEGWITTEGRVPPPEAPPLEGSHGGAHGSSSHGGGAPHGGAQGAGPDGWRFGVIALPAGSLLFQPPTIAGRLLAAGDENQIVVNEALAAQKGLKLGDLFTFQLGPAEATFEIVGVSRESFGSATAYVPLAFYDRRHPDLTNSLRLDLRTSDGEALDAFKTKLDRQLEAAGLRALSMNSQADSRYGYDQHMVMIYVFLLVMSTILAGVGGLGLATTMSLNVLERKREIGILRALGASPRQVWQIFVAESITTSLLAFTIAALAANPASRLVGNYLGQKLFRGGLDFTSEPSGLVVWLVFSLLLGILSSLGPAIKATRGSLRESLSCE